MKTRHLLLFSLFTLLAIILIIQSLMGRNDRKYQVNNISKNKPIFLTQPSYIALDNELISIVNSQNPKIALATLSEIISTDSAVLRSCHALTHQIGRKAYERYQDFGEALKYKDEICNSGYMHGVIEAYFSKSEDVLKDMKTVCNQYPLGKFLSWECYHGIGHGVMYYSSNNLIKSLSMCDSFDAEFAKTACTNGVFMENFNTDQKLHPSEFLDKDNPFYPCQKQNITHKGDCYLYAPTHFLSIHKGGYISALEWCKSAEKPYQQTCAQGVGSQTVKENIDDPKMVEEICESYPELKNSCISGMVGLYINHYGGLEKAKELCEQLDQPNKIICKETAERSATLF